MYATSMSVGNRHVPQGTAHIRDAPNPYATRLNDARRATTAPQLDTRAHAKPVQANWHACSLACMLMLT